MSFRSRNAFAEPEYETRQPIRHNLDALNVLPTLPIPNLQSNMPSIDMANNNNIDETLKCHLCHQSFTAKSDLSQHRNTVHVKKNKKSFKCSICNVDFTQKHSLKNHLLIHSGTKPHKCSYCDKRFRVKYNLRLHLRQHS